MAWPKQGLGVCQLAKATQLVSGGAQLALGVRTAQVLSLFTTNGI